jgi:hypothetical protein
VRCVRPVGSCDESAAAIATDSRGVHSARAMTGATDPTPLIVDLVAQADPTLSAEMIAAEAAKAQKAVNAA